MDVNRREFMALTALTVAGTALLPTEGGANLNSREPIAWFHGDPYLASAVEGGLGGANFQAAREHAMRFRTPATLRDRYVLGLELEHA